jgi:hypothetical protein
VGNTTLAGVVGATGNLTKAGTNNLTVANLNVNDVVVGAGGNLIVKPRGASPLNANNRGVFVNTYNIDPAQGLDFADHDVVVNGSSYTQVRSDVLAAFGGTTGLFSSDSNARSGATILALFDNSLVGATDWLGVPISPTATVGKYTFFGDANIDGQVTGDDYGVIDANLDTTPASGLEWLSGDMNLDGSVTGDDYGVVDANLGSGTTDPFSPGATLSSLSAVPEPGSLTVLVAAGAGMLMRRRRGK